MTLVHYKRCFINFYVASKETTTIKINNCSCLLLNFTAFEIEPICLQRNGSSHEFFRMPPLPKNKEIEYCWINRFPVC